MDFGFILHFGFSFFRSFFLPFFYFFLLFFYLFVFNFHFVGYFVHFKTYFYMQKQDLSQAMMEREGREGGQVWRSSTENIRRVGEDPWGRGEALRVAHCD